MKPRIEDDLHVVTKHALRLEAEIDQLRRALRAEHALLTKHLDAPGYSGTFPDVCEVCALLTKDTP